MYILLVDCKIKKAMDVESSTANKKQQHPLNEEKEGEEKATEEKTSSASKKSS
jgi:hypothetical protein